MASVILPFSVPTMGSTRPTSSPGAGSTSTSTATTGGDSTRRLLNTLQRLDRRRSHAPASWLISPGSPAEKDDRIEHLSWTNGRVVHSRGSAIVRCYSFPHATVQHALFASLPTSSNGFTSSLHASSSTGGPASSSSSSFARNDPLFGRFHPKPPSGWSDEPLPLPLHPPEPSTSSSSDPIRDVSEQSQQRHLLVLLSNDDVYVYPLAPSGGAPSIIPIASTVGAFAASLGDSKVKNIWALPRGVLVELRGQGWKTLGDVKDSLRPVELIGQDDDGTEGTIRQEIIQVVSVDNQNVSCIVSVDKAANKLSVWTCARATPHQTGADDPRGKGKARASSAPSHRRAPTLDADGLPIDQASNDRVGSKRKRTTSIAGSRPSSIAGAAPSASMGITRRISLSAPPQPLHHTETNEEHMLLEALAVSAGSSSVGMKRQPASSSSAGLPSENRRTSVSRNELSVTMDRMALGQGGGSSQTHAMGEGGDRTWGHLTVGDDDDVEEPEESDWVVSRKWGMDLTTDGLPIFDGARAFIFDARNDRAILAILLPRGHTLLLLSIAHGTVTPKHQISASHACVVTHTRGRNVKDLLVKKPGDQGWLLVHAEGRTESISFGSQVGEGPIQALESDGTECIFVTSLEGQRALVRLPANQARLEELSGMCLEALSHVLDMNTFVQIEQAVRCNPAGPGWDALVEVIERQFGIQPSRAAQGDNDAQRVIRHMVETRRNDPLLAILRPSSSLQSNGLPRSSRPAAWPSDPRARDTLEAILATLHLVAEELKLSMIKRKQYEVVGKFVLRLAMASGLDGWVDAYRRALGLPQALNGSVVSSIATSTTKLPSSPPFVMEHLAMILRGTTTQPNGSPNLTAATFDLSRLAHSFGFISSPFYGGWGVGPLSTTRHVIELYEILVNRPDGEPGGSLARSKNVVQALHERGFDVKSLDDLAFGVGLVLREAVRMCQSDAPPGWDDATYELIRRPDLARQGKGAGKGKGKAQRDGMGALPHLAIHGRPLSIQAIAQRTKAGQLIDTTSAANPLSEKEATVASIPKAVRFNEDRRLEEVMRMLQFVDPVTIGGDRADRTLDQLTPQTQQSLLTFLSNRTLALPVGFGLFTFRTKASAPTDAVTIPSINTSARILPMPSPVALIEKEPRETAGSVHPDRFEWPHFHAGVASALQYQAAPSMAFADMDDAAGGFDASHISFNKPAELDSKHAGFLFGLGLSGHLNKIAFSQAFEYLKMKHDPTSIGLLLGLAATYLGTGDPKVTSLLSVHLAALHPPHSSTLNVSGITQAAALVGLGLLHIGSTKRTLADVMVRELCGIRVTAVEDAGACREAYALSAGFAFGLIMLASGTDAKATPGEVELLRTLRALVTGDSNHALPTPAGSSSRAHNVTDVNVTSSAATIALALMYLRTERHDVASLLEIPDTHRRLDYVRADLLLVRTLARALVLWDRIQLSKTWVDSHVPIFISQAAEAAKQKNKTLESDLDIARWNIVAGACFAIGLKFAGTAAAEAHGTLIHYLDRLTRAAYTKAPTVQAKIRRHAIRCCLSVVAVALSMVMAGTGEINVLRRLRVAHGHFGEGVTYGTHLASHMSLGLLFVGSGHFTLGTSNSAVAALLLAFYPSFPPTPMENRAHLQAFRHLWTLAVEPRCLVARDVDTGESTFLPVRLRLLEPASTATSTTTTTEVRSKQLVAPTLIPELKLIHTIQVDTPRYWSFALNFSTSSTTANSPLSSFLADRTTLWVKRRTGHLSYAQDPRGIRSIFTRSKSETGSAVLDFGPTARSLSPSSSGLRDFVTSFSDDVEAQAMVEWLCDPRSGRDRLPTEWEAFGATVLLECLTKDKKDVVGTYHALFHARRLEGCEKILANEQALFVVDLYKTKVFSTWFGDVRSGKKASSKATSPAARETLLHSAFVDYLALSGADLSFGRSSPLDTQADTTIQDYVLQGHWPTDSVEAERVSSFVAQHHVPSSRTLRTMMEVIREDPENAEVRLHALGVAMERETGMRAWSDEFGKTLLRMLGIE